MVRVFFSAVVAAAPSSQYDGGYSRQRAGEGGRCSARGSGSDSVSDQWEDGNRRPFPTGYANREWPGARSAWRAFPMANERADGEAYLQWQLLGNVERQSDARRVTGGLEGLSRWCHPGKKSSRTALKNAEQRRGSTLHTHHYTSVWTFLWLYRNIIIIIDNIELGCLSYLISLKAKGVLTGCSSGFWRFNPT